MKKFLPKPLLILIGLAVGFMIVELSLRLLGLPRFEKARENEFTGGLTFYFSAREPGYLMHRILPHTDYLNIYASNPRGYFDEDNTIRLSANNKGFRGPDIEPLDGEGPLRIAFLGDSVTLGEGVKFPEIYSERTVEMLNERWGSKRRFRSYNFAMLAYNTTQEYSILHEEALRLKPDVVVLGYFLNDAAEPYFSRDPETNRIDSVRNETFGYELVEPPPETFLYSFRIARFIWKLMNRRDVSARTIEYFHALYRDENPNWEINKKNLKRIITSCEARKIPLIVLCLPVLYELNDSYPFKRLHDVVERVVKESMKGNTVYVDIFPYLKGMDAEGLWVHPTDHHPNEIAHRIIAEVLSEMIAGALNLK